MAMSKPARRPLKELNGKTRWGVVDMKKAIEEVASQKKSLWQAARDDGVPVTTLKRRLDRSLPADAKPGSLTVLQRRRKTS